MKERRLIPTKTKKDSCRGFARHESFFSFSLAAAVEARALGYGGVSAVADATGLARGTIHRALAELRRRSASVAHEQIRARGAGRPRLVDRQPEIQTRLQALERIATYGLPEDREPGERGQSYGSGPSRDDDHSLGR